MKLFQISANQNGCYALDQDGQLWYCKDEGRGIFKWGAMPMPVKKTQEELKTRELSCKHNVWIVSSDINGQCRNCLKIMKQSEFIGPPEAV